MTHELPRSIGVLGGAAITVGVMIGTGIFRTPASIAQEMGSPWLILLMWAAGGMLCLCGALTYAELGTMFPRSGGMYVYLHEGLGPQAAFVFGWTYFLITQPMALGGLATVVSEHLNLLVDAELNIPATTCAVILLVALVNTGGMRLGSAIAVALTGLKVAALVGIVALVAMLSEGGGGGFAATPAPKGFWAALVPVTVAVLWTYDGWSDSSAVAEEIREPQKRLPRILMLGTLGTMGLYLAVNAAYFRLLPLEDMRATQTVAPLVMERLLGSAGGVVVTVMIMISSLGATHASTIVGSRVMFAQARDKLLFGFLSRVSSTRRTPMVAIWMQAVMACLAVQWLKEFEPLMSGFVFSIWVFYGLSVSAIFILRVRRPDFPRSYRCWGYPVVPAVFVLLAAGLTVMSIMDNPRQTLSWVAVLLAGVPAYYVWQKVVRARETNR